MHRIKWLFLTLVISLSISGNVQAMNPKVKVMLTTAAYGTVGGALLGTASNGHRLRPVLTSSCCLLC